MDIKLRFCCSESNVSSLEAAKHPALMPGQSITHSLPNQAATVRHVRLEATATTSPWSAQIARQ